MCRTHTHICSKQKGFIRVMPSPARSYIYGILYSIDIGKAHSTTLNYRGPTKVYY